MALLAMVPGVADAAVGVRATEVLTKHCTAQVESQAKTRELVIVAHACSTGTQKDAVRAAIDDCGCGTLLVTYYQNVGLTGYDEDIYGDAGTCDNSGYGFRDLTAVNSAVNGISSFQMYGLCRVADVCKYAGFGTCSSPFYGQRQTYIGAAYNDNVRSGWVWLG
jgi:hypothetical protein